MKSKALFLSVFMSVQFVFAGVFLEPLKGSDKIFRGRAPRAAEMKKLTKTGITAVLIFKNQVKTEVDDEISQLTQAGLDRKNIYTIPFQWKDIKSEKKACEQVVEALAILQKIENSEEDKILFHCTVGEDRTGLLAGLMSQLLMTEDTESSFRNQMCDKGYSDGNPKKPLNVTREVEKTLTPLYFKMSKMIENGTLSSRLLKKSACRDIENMEAAHAKRSCSR